MTRDSQMGIEEIGHRSSHKLKLRVHKWVKDWKKQVNYIYRALTTCWKCSKCLGCIDSESYGMALKPARQKG